MSSQADLSLMAQTIERLKAEIAQLWTDLDRASQHVAALERLAAVMVLGMPEVAPIENVVHLVPRLPANQRTAILHLLGQSPSAIGPKEVARQMRAQGMPCQTSSVQNVMRQMAREQQIVKVAHGLYAAHGVAVVGE